MWLQSIAFWWHVANPANPRFCSIVSAPADKKSSIAKDAPNWFWGNDKDSLNYFVELTIQSRIQDLWYSRFLDERRKGRLSDEMYNYIVGLPTEHPGSWIPDVMGTGYVCCHNGACKDLHVHWKDMALAGEPWSVMQQLECSSCKQERDRRNRLVMPEDPRLKIEPFLSPPYVHQNNGPT